MKFNGLSNKEKAEHIWEYYRLHIIGTALALFFLVSLLNHFVFSPPRPPYVATAFYGVFAFRWDLERYDAAIDAWLDTFVPFETSQSFSFNPSDTPDMYAAAVQQKFFILVAAGELDLMVIHSNFFEFLNAQGLFYTNAAPVCLADNAFFAALGIDTTEAVLAVMANSSRRENAIRTKQYITSY